MVVYGSQTPDYKAALFILPGKEMCGYDLILEPPLSSPHPISTVHSEALLKFVGSLVLTTGCLPLHRAV